MELRINNISKKYRNTDALKEVSICFAPGIYGILGRNGAGKTTLFRLITHLLEPTSGTISLTDGDELTSKYDRCIGYMPQEFGFPAHLTVKEILEQICIMRDLKRSEIQKEITEKAKDVGLEGRLNSKFASLSGGMKRRLGIAQALIGDPSVLILDEPTAGVDPVERVAIRSIINEYAIDRIVLVSTHIISDIEQICERLVVLEAGKMSFNGTVSQLINMARSRLSKMIFNDITDFDNYLKHNQIYTFRRVGESLEVIVPKQNGSESSYDICLEDAYMWVISHENNKTISE